MLQRYGMVFGSISVPIAMQFVFGGRIPNLNWIIAEMAAVLLPVLTARVPKSKDSSRGFASPFAHELKEAFRSAKIWTLSEHLRHLNPRYVLCVAGGILLFGIADGVAASIFWPRINELDFTTPLAFGLVVAACSVARVIGIQLGSRSKSRYTVVGCISAASVFFLSFALIHQPVIALMVWLLRIISLSFYFPSVLAIVDSAVSKKDGATFQSAASLLYALGLAIGGLVVAACIPLMGQTATITAGAALAVASAGLWFTALRTEKERLVLCVTS